jgi:hypothetical protein
VGLDVTGLASRTSPVAGFDTVNSPRHRPVTLAVPQAAFSAVVEGLVDGLVAPMPRRPVGVGLALMRRDLRRTPLLLEKDLDDLPQFRLPGQERTP